MSNGNTYGWWDPKGWYAPPPLNETVPALELTPEEKATNRRISQIRIRVEHAISGVKRFRIVKDEIRNWKEGFRDEVMETCCGLHNFRLNFRPWHYAALVT